MSAHHIFSHVGHAFAIWHRRRRSRRELANLQAIELSDFGCTAAEAGSEASKWFWQA